MYVSFFLLTTYRYTFSGFIYPVVTHWAWADEGWLLQGGTYIIDGKSVNIGYAVIEFCTPLI